jgi:N,N'-diacetyllegionaminate synthase
MTNKINKIIKNRPFLIAEIANAHCGSTSKLDQLVNKIIEIKPDAIKFQFFKASELLSKNHPEFKIYKNLEISENIWKNIFYKIKKNNIKIFVDVFSIAQAKLANKLGADSFKIHSSDVNNEELLLYVERLGKPVLLSCSGCTENEIDNAIRILNNNNKIEIILMHGFQGFPTKLSEINLNRITKLREKFSLPVGYMDHISGDSYLSKHLPIMALGLGAQIIEKHITLNRKNKDEDYQSSLNPDEFLEMKKIINDSFKSLGTNFNEFSKSELNYRNSMKKKNLAAKNMTKNHEIQNKDIMLKRFASKSSSFSKDVLVGSITKKSIQKEEILNENNITPKNKIAAVIACRVDSTRLFAKPLQLVGEKPILEHIINQLKKCKSIDEIVLAISENKGNEKFIQFAKINKIKYVTGDDFDVLGRIIKGAEYVKSNIVVRVTSEDPIKHFIEINSTIQKHIKNKFDYSQCLEGLPEGTGFEIINLDALKKSHKLGKQKHKSELVTSYINENRKKFHIQTVKILKNIKYPNIRLTVDNPEDLILMRGILKISKKKQIPTLDQVIKLIQTNTELIKLHENTKNVA